MSYVWRQHQLHMIIIIFLLLFVQKHICVLLYIYEVLQIQIDLSEVKNFAPKKAFILQLFGGKTVWREL